MSKTNIVCGRLWWHVGGYGGTWQGVGTCGRGGDWVCGNVAGGGGFSKGIGHKEGGGVWKCGRGYGMWPMTNSFL